MTETRLHWLASEIRDLHRKADALVEEFVQIAWRSSPVFPRACGHVPIRNDCADCQEAAVIGKDALSAPDAGADVKQYVCPTCGRDYDAGEVKVETGTWMTPVAVCPSCNGSLSRRWGDDAPFAPLADDVSHAVRTDPCYHHRIWSVAPEGGGIAHECERCGQRFVAEGVRSASPDDGGSVPVSYESFAQALHLLMHRAATYRMRYKDGGAATFNEGELLDDALKRAHDTLFPLLTQTSDDNPSHGGES